MNASPGEVRVTFSCCPGGAVPVGPSRCTQIWCVIGYGGLRLCVAVNNGLLCCVPALVQVFSVSSSLDGSAVLLYFSALCAISSEELNQPKPRMTFLQKLVHCAFANSGEHSLRHTAHRSTSQLDYISLVN